MTGLANPSKKRKPSEKVDCQSKKPKVATRSIVWEFPDSSNLPPKLGLGKGKGLMMGHDPITEKHPVLLLEDSGYVLKQLSSIIKDDEYKDLGNHATKAIKEMGLFSLAYVCLFVPFLCFVLLLSLFNICF